VASGLIANFQADGGDGSAGQQGGECVNSKWQASRN
jgi:hypothetical protein